MSTLKETKIGETVRVESIEGERVLRQHFLDMGIIPGTEITVVKYAPMGDPAEIKLHGYELTLRLSDAEKIMVSTVKEGKKNLPKKEKKPRSHPGLGESGKFHPKGSGDPLPEGTVLKFALVGNQNSGKTTLFNRLTGSNQHVGNFPGVTVEKKEGAIKGRKNTIVTDLPGIYSMSPYSKEEIVSRNYTLDEKPHAIINIVDATNIERNLYLTMQLLQMNIPMVVALNMMDELSANGGSIDVNTMEEYLGVPVVPISAAKNEGVQELIEHALHVAHYREKPLYRDFCDKLSQGGAVHRCLHGIRHLIEDHAEKSELPLNFAAEKVAEGDELVLDRLKLDQNEEEALEHIVVQMEKERGLDRQAAIADMRYSFISLMCRQTVSKPVESKERKRSEKIDRFLTGKYTAIPAFIVIMFLICYLSFNVIGAWLQGLLEGGIDSLTAMADAALVRGNTNEAVRGLVIEGIFAGVGGVLSFLPIIVTLFFFLSILEDSGYIARVAFFMDKILRKLGLSGRSIVPMLIGFGCTVPAVMATRTLPSERDRKLTILLTPFMSCSAKIPIYAFFVNAFFPKKGGFIMAGLYILGVVVSILIALLYKLTLFKGEAVPFVMELPNYRLPAPKNVMRLLWEKAKDFLQRAFSVILVATIAVWFLRSFDGEFNMVQNQENSLLAYIAGFVAPIMKPVGMGEWKICVSFVSGFIAKESVVSTLNILFSGHVGSIMSPLTVASILVFSLLYTPCVAAIASVKRELGWKWAAFVVLWQCIVAWIVTFIVRLILMLLGVS